MYLRGGKKPRERTLAALIEKAEEKYKFMHKGRLEPLMHEANQILHAYGSRKEKPSRKDEDLIIRFLKTLKYVIERAPK